jgi:DNA processing protein
VDSRAAYVALALTPGIGAARLTTLLRVFETPDGALTAPFAFLCSLPGISRASATAICSTRIDEGERVLTMLDRLGGHCLLPGDAAFPPLLAAIPSPPTLLFAKGDLALLTRPAVAIVGSRNHSVYGAEVAGIVAAHAAKAGIAVVSGMARGLDAVAHSSALDSRGPTIGVLGNGLGVIYPAANRALYERVAELGLLITEFPPGERPRVGSFPRRNRLISGLARVTVVIEAAAGSGTLITVESALDQGREVMAVPGTITSATSIGTNRLLRDGATPLLEPEDLLRFYPEVDPKEASPVITQVPAMEPALPASLSNAEREVVELMGGEPAGLDALVAGSRRPVHEVLVLLSGLELAGVVEQVPGWRFRRRNAGDAIAT